MEKRNNYLSPGLKFVNLVGLSLLCESSDTGTLAIIQSEVKEEMFNW